MSVIDQEWESEREKEEKTLKDAIKHPAAHSSTIGLRILGT